MNEQTKTYEHPHWPTCWRDPGHQGCAVRKVEHLQVELYKCRAQLRGVQAVLDIERDKWAATHEKLQGRLDVAQGTLAIAVEMEEDLDGQRRVLAERLAAAEAREQAVIRECVPPEWVGADDGQGPAWCPQCRMLKPDGHTSDCIHTALDAWNCDKHAALDAYVKERTAELQEQRALDALTRAELRTKLSHCQEELDMTSDNESALNETALQLRAKLAAAEAELRKWQKPLDDENFRAVREQGQQSSLAAKQAYINALEFRLAAAEAREQRYARFATKSVEVMRKNGYVLDDLDDRWQKLVFTLHNMLVRIACDVKESDHAALDAALEARAVDVLRGVAQGIEQGLARWDYAMSPAEIAVLHQVRQAHGAALEQARGSADQAVP